MDSAGDFVVAWNLYEGQYEGYAIYAQQYNSTAHPEGSEFQVNTFTTAGQWQPAVAMDSAGDFAVAWYANGDGGGSDYGIFAQRYEVSPFAVSGSTLTIYGTSGADNLSFAPATNNSFTVTMDSFTAMYGFSDIQTIDFIGEGGADTTTLYLPANCMVNMSPDSATVSGSSAPAQPFTLSVSQSPLIIVHDNAASTSSNATMYRTRLGSTRFWLFGLCLPARARLYEPGVRL